MGINDADLKEYIVTLHRIEDLELFYDDIETPGGNLYIPDRAVPVYNRRPNSPNTHYYLTDQEAEQLRNDPRVAGVSVTLASTGFNFVPKWTQTSNNWFKGESSPTMTDGIMRSDDKNWGLLRCTTKNNNDAAWGWDTGNRRISGTAQTDADGLNVDVVIVDGLFRANHAELCDANGNPRRQNINWFQYYQASNLSPTYNYNHPDRDQGETDHGAHVAGTAVGNSQGWARKANLFNLSPYGEQGLTPDLILDPIRNWHIAKSINPATGVKNPTVINMSIGAPEHFILIDLQNTGRIASALREINYRGVRYTGPWTTTGNGSKTYRELGIPYGARQWFLDEGDSSWYLRLIHVAQGTTEYTAFNADVENLINVHGCHIVVSAGNESFKQDIPGGIDYDNNVRTQNAATYFYNRASCPATPSTISVGSANSDATAKISSFSNRGPAVTVFAPGSGIVSAIDRQARIAGSTPDISVADPRLRNSDRIDSYNGTSMAAPQVTGVVACLLEKTPSTTPAAMKALIINESYKNQLLDAGGNFAFDGSQNRLLRYPLAGVVTTQGPGTTSTSTSTNPPTTPPPTITLGEFFLLKITPGTTISEGDTAEICLEVNPLKTPSGTQIPFTITVAPI